jgi:Phospholipase_D-nuclease N-terminal
MIGGICDLRKPDRILGEKQTAMKTFLLAAYAILSLYAIADVLKSSRDWATKVVLIAIILIPFVGAGLYLFAFRDKGY